MSGQRKKFGKLYEYSLEQDIRYKGPLSYQRLMALGWLMIVFAVLRILLSALVTSGKDPEMIRTTDPYIAVLEYLSGFFVLLLLIANFAQIMNNDGKYKTCSFRTGWRLPRFSEPLGSFLPAMWWVPSV